MQAIKKQFKDFWLYFRCFNKGISSTSNSSSAMWFKENGFMLFALIVSVIFFTVHLNGSLNTFTFNIPMAFLAGAAFGVGASARIKPSLMSVAPFSPKQRVVFSYLSAELMAIICMVFYTLFIILIMCIIALLAFVFSGENIFVISENVTHTSANFDLFVLFYMLYVWASVYAISHIKRRKYRNIAMAVWAVVTEALLLLFVNICNSLFLKQSGAAYEFAFMVELNDAINSLALPWLPALIMSLLALAAFAVSLVTSIRFYRSSDI